jgi:hypothetical protein
MSRMPAGSRPVGGLVEDQEPGLAQQARRDAEALAHAVGVASDLAVGAVDEVDGGQHLLDQARPRASVQAGEALQVLPAGEVGVEAGRLDEAGDAPEHGGPVAVPGAAEDAQGAGVGPDQAEEHAQERRLARAVGAEDAVDLPGRDPDRDAVDGAHGPEGLHDAVGFDGEWRCHAAEPRGTQMSAG